MSFRRTNDKDIFHNVIDIGLRMYGNGYSYPTCTVDHIMEYCRQQLRCYFFKHKQLMVTCSNKRMSHMNTLVFTSRHKKTCLKRLQQFVQTKDRSTVQQDELCNNIVKESKLTITDRFIRTCRQLQVHLDYNQNEAMPLTLDRERSRQYARLDAYYKSDTLTPNAYLSFVEQQHSSFNNLRLLSTTDILQWLRLNDYYSFSIKSTSNQDLRLAEICLFLIKEILLNLMDQVHQSTIPCSIEDVLRRRHVHNNYRLPFSGRKRLIR